MATKKCSCCNAEKSEDEFSIVGGKQQYLRPECKVCRRLNSKEYYKTSTKKTKAFISNLGCCVCGVTRYEVLEVHHLHTSYKKFGRSQSATSNVKDIKAHKAIVVCANDHVLFHSHFGGKYAPFPPQTKQSVIDICLLERAKGGL